jgi:hypothetical protein
VGPGTAAEGWCQGELAEPAAAASAPQVGSTAWPSSADQVLSMGWPPPVSGLRRAAPDPGGLGELEEGAVAVPPGQALLPRVAGLDEARRRIGGEP